MTLKVARGDPLTATLWNRVIDSLPLQEQSGGVSTGIINPVAVQFENTTAADLDSGELVRLESYQGPDDTNPYEVPDGATYKGNTVDQDTRRQEIAIVAEPVKINDYGTAVLHGLALAKITPVNATDNWIKVPASGAIADTAATGFAPILHRISPSGGSDTHAIVLIGTHPGGMLAKTRSGGIPASDGVTLGQADVDVYDYDWNTKAISNAGYTEKVFNAFSGQIQETTWILCKWIDGRWFIDAEDCPAVSPMSWQGDWQAPT